MSKRLHTSSVTSRTSLRLQIDQQSRQEPIVGHDSVRRPYVDKWWPTWSPDLKLVKPEKTVDQPCYSQCIYPSYNNQKTFFAQSRTHINNTRLCLLHWKVWRSRSQLWSNTTPVFWTTHCPKSHFWIYTVGDNSTPHETADRLLPQPLNMPFALHFWTKAYLILLNMFIASVQEGYASILITGLAPTVTTYQYYLVGNLKKKNIIGSQSGRSWQSWVLELKATELEDVCFLIWESFLVLKTDREYLSWTCHLGGGLFIRLSNFQKEVTPWLLQP